MLQMMATEPPSANFTDMWLEANATAAPTNATNIFHYAEEAIGFAKNHVIIIVIVVIILIILLCALGALIRRVIKGLNEAKERAMSKFNALLSSKEALDLPEAVPDMEVSHVQPAHARKKMTNLGEVRFSVHYDSHSSELVVVVFDCNDLPVKYTGGTYYTYVELELFPYHSMAVTKPKTKYARSSLEPMFFDELRFKMTKVEMKDQKLYLHVCDYNQMSTRDLIGSYYVDLSSVNFGKKPTEFKGQLQWIEGIRGAERGDMHLSLSYVSGFSQLVVCPQEIKGLKPAPGRSTVNAYCKIFVLHGTKELGCRKTRVRKKNLEPRFNEKFVFIVPQDLVEQVNVYIRVKDVNVIGRKIMLGELCLGAHATGECLRHWKLMIERGTEIVMWHALEYLDIEPSKTSLSTVMRDQPSTESEETEEEDDDGGLFGISLPIDMPSLPGMGLFSSDEKESESKKDEKPSSPSDETVEAERTL